MRSLPAIAIRLLCVVAFALGCSAKPSGVESKRRPLEEVAGAAELVETASVARGPVQSVLTTSGSVAARRSTPIGPAIAGRILHIFVNVGDEVPFGAPLFQIDPEPYAILLRDAEAGLLLARVQSEEASDEASRLRALADKQMISPLEHNRAGTRAKVARARVEQAEANLARVRADLHRSLVLAPYAGSIVARDAHEGIMATVTPNTRVLVLQESGVLEALLDVPEAGGVAVRVGDAVRLWIEGHPDPLDSEVRAVSREIDRGTRTYSVRASVADPEQTIKSGAFVRAEITPRPRGDALRIERSALVQQEGEASVFRVVDGRAERVPLRIGVIGSRWVEVLGGLGEGDRVVVGDAVARLSDGARIREPDVAAAPTDPEQVAEVAGAEAPR